MADSPSPASTNRFDGGEIVALVERHVALNGWHASVPDALTTSQLRAAIKHAAGIDSSGLSRFTKPQLQAILTALGSHPDGSHTTNGLRAHIADTAGLDHDPTADAFRKRELGELLKALVKNGHHDNRRLSQQDSQRLSGKPQTVLPLLTPIVIGGSLSVIGLVVINAVLEDLVQSAGEIETVCGLGCTTPDLVVPAAFTVGFAAVITIVAPAVAAAVSRLRSAHQYPVTTVALSQPRRWVDSTDTTSQGCSECINCELKNARGHTVQFGTERVLFGVIIDRTTVGEIDECVSCADADVLEYARRGRMDDPPSPNDQATGGGA